jgi:AraC family transcriptional regulator
MAKRAAKRKAGARSARKSKPAKKALKAKPAKKITKAKKAAKTKPVKKVARAKPKAKAKTVKKPVKKFVGKTAPKASPRMAAKPAPKPTPKPVRRAPVRKPAAAAPRAPRIDARHDIGRTMLIAGLGGWYDAATRTEIPDLWQRFASEFIGKVPARADQKVYYGICANMNGQGGLDYYAAIEVPSAEGLPEGLKPFELAQRRYAVFTHRGPIAKISDTWMAIFEDWMPRSGHSMADAPAFELYHDDRFDPKTGMGEVEIWIPLQS